MSLNPAKWGEQLARWSAVRAFRDTREDFYEDLADAMRDSERLATFIEVRRARAIKQKDPLAALYGEWLERMNRRGGKLSYILSGSAPDNDVMILSAVEDKGDLPASLRFIASTIKDQRSMRSALMSAIFMPLIVSIIMVIFLVTLSVFVIPVFAEIASPEKWNTIGRIMYAISYAITNYGIFMLLAVLAFAAWFSWSLNNWTGPTRDKLDNYLPYRVYRDYTGSIFMVSLASMLRFGDTVVRSLEHLKKRAPAWLRYHIAKVVRNIDKTSGQFGEAFATGVFSQQLTNRLIDQSRRSSEFDKVIARIGIEGIAKVRFEVEASAKKLNIMLICSLGLVLAFMLVGTLLTAQGLSQSLKAEVQSQSIQR